MRARAFSLALFILVILNFGTKIEGVNNHDDGHRLLADILSLHNHEYHSKLRPVNDTTQPLLVKFGVALNQLIDVDEYLQVIKANVWMRLQWRDDILQWDPDDYNGTDKLFIPSGYLWRPDLVLYNTADKDINVHSEDIIAILQHNGMVNYMFPAQFMSSCQMHFMHFPFDEQICELKFGSWAYNGLMLDLEMRDEYPADYRNYHFNSAWALLNFTATRNVEYYGCCPDVPYPDITFVMTIQRRYEMKVLYLIIPNLLINITALMQFMLPCDSGERVTLGITIYLSMVVYLLLIQELIPASDSVPILVRYIIATMIMISVSQITSMFVLRLHHNGTHDNDLQVPPWARRYLLHGLARILCMHDLIVPDDVHENKLSATVDTTALIVDTEPTTNELVEVESEAEIEVQKESLNTLATDPSWDSPRSSKIRANQVSPVQRMMQRLPLKPPQFLEKPTDQNKRRSSVNILRGAESATIIKRSDLKKNKELLLYKILRHCEDVCEQRATESRLAEVKCEWQQMAMLIDRFMLYLYVVITFCLWIVLFSSIPVPKETIL